MNGHELARVIASMTNGTVRDLPCDARWPAFGVEIAPAGCAVLVRDHGHLNSVSIGARWWRLTPAEPLPSEVASEAATWIAANPEDATLTDAALALAPALGSALGQNFELSIPGGQPAPTEMWLHPAEDMSRASVGIFSDVITFGDARIAMPRRRNLPSACAAAVPLVRKQLAAYEHNVALSETCKREAARLASALGATWQTSGAPTASYAYATTTVIVAGGHDVAHVTAEGGVMRVDAGLPGADGWHGTIERAFAELDAVRAAIAAMDRVVTFASLREGARYKVIASFAELSEGDVVTYGGELDNHAPHVFTLQTGKEVLVNEWDLRQNVHRVLALA